MNSITIDTLKILGTGVTDYIVEPVQGIDIPPSRIASYDNAGRDGAVVANALYGPRLITLNGVIKGSNYLTARRALIQSCRLQRSGSSAVLTPVTFVTTDGLTLTAKVTLKSFQSVYKLPNSPFQIQVIAPDPLLYSASQSTSGLVSRPTGGGVIYPVTYPAIYGSSTGGVATFNNVGSADVLPVIYLRGALTNPTVSFGNASFSLLVTTTQASDVITLDMGNRTVVLNGSVSLLTNKTADSSWFSLPPGISTVRFSTGSAGDGGTVEVTAHSAYLGV